MYLIVFLYEGAIRIGVLGNFNKHKFADSANLIAVHDIRFLYIIFFINQKNSLTELIGVFFFLQKNGQPLQMQMNHSIAWVN